MALKVLHLSMLLGCESKYMLSKITNANSIILIYIIIKYISLCLTIDIKYTAFK